MDEIVPFTIDLFSGLSLVGLIALAVLALVLGVRR